MKAVIFCGGLGTRIREVDDRLPKPMIPVGDKPILWHIMKHYAKYGVNEFILCLGYKGHVIKNFFLLYLEMLCDFQLIFRTRKIEYFGDQPERNWLVTLADTGLDSGTAERLRRVRKYLRDDEPFFLTYGDGLSNVNLNDLLNHHKKFGRLVTLTGVNPPGRFGELEHDNGLVTQFNEKPQTSAGLINGGFMVCEPRMFEWIHDMYETFEDEPLRQFAQNKALAVYVHNGFWQCMDTPRDYQLLNELAKKESPPWEE